MSEKNGPCKGEGGASPSPFLNSFSFLIHSLRLGQGERDECTQSSPTLEISHHQNLGPLPFPRFTQHPWPQPCSWGAPGRVLSADWAANFTSTCWSPMVSPTSIALACVKRIDPFSDWGIGTVLWAQKPPEHNMYFNESSTCKPPRGFHQIPNSDLKK